MVPAGNNFQLMSKIGTEKKHSILYNLLQTTLHEAQNILFWDKHNVILVDDQPSVDNSWKQN